MLHMVKPHQFNEKDPVSVLGFFRTFRDACDTNDVHEGAAMGLMTDFLDGAPKDMLELFMKSITAKAKTRD